MFKGTEKFGTSDYAAEKPMLDEIERLFEVYRKTSDEAERAAIYHRIDSISYEASKIAIPNEYDKLMAAIGANGTNAFTSQDMTVYVEDIPSNQIDNWAKIQADRFLNPVIRGFHTELETIYEEKNMSLTQDSRKIWEAMDAALFPNHPYGTQTVLGTQESLKNPSITNVKNYHKTYYVPNNMAVCVSGDFDPDEMIATIDKYFGGMQPNPDLPKLEFKPEEPITAPVVKEVYGPEAARVMLGWRLPAATDPSNDVADIVGSVLYNGQAGLIDLDLNQQQKVLSAYAYASTQPDYGTFLMAGSPKAGQSLDEVRDLLLAEAAKIRAGEFDEGLIEASVNNYKMQLMNEFDKYDQRAMFYVYSFIYGKEWADDIRQLDRMEKITKQDVVDWANKYLGPESYAIVYKREGKDPNEQKIAAPKITPIATNRDAQSAFLVEIQNSEVKPIEPVFVDYGKDMSQFEARKGIDVLYKKNESNDIFSLTYVFDTGTESDPAPQPGVRLPELPRLRIADGRADRLENVRHRLLVLDAGRTQFMPYLDQGIEREHGPGDGDRRRTAERRQTRRGDSRQSQGRQDQEPRRQQTQPEPLLRRPANLLVLRARLHPPHDTHQPGTRSHNLRGAAGEGSRPAGQTAQGALLRPAVGNGSEGGPGRTPQNACGTPTAREKTPAAVAHGRKQSADGPIRRQAALLPPVCEPRQTVRRHGRPRNHALQRVFRRRHELGRVPGDARGTRPGLLGFGIHHAAALWRHEVRLHGFHRHAERQDADGDRSFRRNHQPDARIGGCVQRSPRKG